MNAEKVQPGRRKKGRVHRFRRSRRDDIVNDEQIGFCRTRSRRPILDRCPVGLGTSARCPRSLSGHYRGGKIRRLLACIFLRDCDIATQKEGESHRERDFESNAMITGILFDNSG